MTSLPLSSRRNPRAPKMRSAFVVSVAIAATVIAATSSPFVLAVHAQSEELTIGTVVGNVLSTDIRTFVNGAPIRSMNIDGNTAVVAEDLRGYGFDVSWNPQERRVTIYPDPAKPAHPQPVSAATNQEVGVMIGQVLATDIHTIVNGTDIPSFNIGGQTAVYLKDLAALGKVDWDEKARKATLTENQPASVDPKAAQSAAYPLQAEQMSSNVFYVDFKDNDMFIGDDRIGFGQDGLAMLSVSDMAGMLGYQTEQRDDGGIYVTDGTYGFTIGPDPEKAETYWFGGPAGYTDKLTFPAVQRDGKWYVAEYDLKELFGYDGTWDPDKRVLKVDYAQFDVQDFGAAVVKDNYFYAVQGRLYGLLSTELPNLFVIAESADGRKYGSGSGAGVTDLPTTGSSPVYQFSSAAPLQLGDNEVTVEYRVRKRILFHATVSNPLDPDRLDPVLNYDELPHSNGEFSHISLEQPATAHVLAANGEVQLEGKVDSPVGGGLVAVIEREADGNWTDAESVIIPFDSGSFTAKLTLGHGKGHYRVTLRSALITGSPRQADPHIDVARLYVDY